MDIKAEDLPPIKQMFVESVNSMIIDKDDYSVIPLSIADERGKCFYHYDLDLPEELEVLEKVIGNDNLEVFNLKDNTFVDIDALIILLADHNNVISLYKKLSSVEIIGRGGYMLWKSNRRLERFEELLLRICSNFQVIRIGDQIVILNLRSIEKSFGFHDVIKREAALGLEAIRNLNLVSNIECLQNSIDDITFARKLTKVAKSSPVINLNIPNATVISFSKTHPATQKKMRYTADNSQISLDTKVSKELFIKLLNDDFLTSELTKLYYESLAKDTI